MEKTKRLAEITSEKYPLKTYESKEFQEHRATLNAVLRKEQKGLCAYCCGRIEEKNSHNEHIEPQHPGKFSSSRSLDYTNIVASCNHSKTCGIRKGNKYSAEQFISPLDENTEEYPAFYNVIKWYWNTL